jgi:hypothetical protein
MMFNIPFQGKQALILLSTFVLIACGGGNEKPTSNSQSAEPQVQLQLAQSHVVPPQGLQWPNNTAGHLRISAGRDTLILAKFEGVTVTKPVLEVLQGSSVIGSYLLKPPKDLPMSEGGEGRFDANTWSINLPADKVFPGMAIKVRDGGRTLLMQNEIAVAPKTSVTFQLLSYLLFGAKRDTSGVMAMSDSERAQAAAGMPFTTSSFVDHPIGAFESSYVILPPNGTQAATKASSHNDMGPGGNILLDMTWLINHAAGDLGLNRMTFAAQYMLKADGTRGWAGGGVAYTGSGVSTGDPSFGLLWHEGGHALSLGHSPADYKNGTYPYEAGSLKGSAWGYDQSKGYFRSPLTTPNSWYSNCEGVKAQRGGQLFAKNAQGRCYRFDPMHSAEDQKDPQATFPLFADYNVGRMQRWALQRDAINDSGTGFQRLGADGKWADLPIATKDNAWDGLNGQLPANTGKDMDFVYVTHSTAGTTLASQFYKPVRHIGNGLQLIDPMDSVQLASIHATNGGKASAPYYKYCRMSGCDFTVRLTYEGLADPQYRVLRGSARKWDKPDQWKDNASEEKQRDSFLMWAMNIPTPTGNPRLKKLELLETPKVWSMTPAAIADATVASVLEIE